MLLMPALPCSPTTTIGAAAHRPTARPQLVDSEIRAGACDPDGEMLAIHD